MKPWFWTAGALAGLRQIARALGFEGSDGAMPARVPAVQMLLALAALLLITGAQAQTTPPPVNAAAIAAERPPELLSAYRFFRDAQARTPNAGVTPYALNTALYSDGAIKFRYVYIPLGQRAAYSADDVFDFPVGTVLIKTFAFAADMAHPDENVRLLETRLLIRRANGWVALPYVWNEAQTEARLSPIGATLPVEFTDADGAAVALDWAVPNRNQCKGCHDRAGDLMPIGPTARNLNRGIIYPDHGLPEEFFETGHLAQINQLAAWRQRGLLADTPDTLPFMPDAFRESAGSLDLRARAYLDVNCAHCHNPEGPAHTSGLDLRWAQHDPALWGVMKRPVAAGRGSAGYDFAIEPGRPERSILLYRMQSTDPGVMMPELGRQRVDAHAVALVQDWIAGMDAEGRMRE